MLNVRLFGLEFESPKSDMIASRKRVKTLGLRASSTKSHERRAAVVSRPAPKIAAWACQLGRRRQRVNGKAATYQVLGLEALLDLDTLSPVASVGRTSWLLRLRPFQFQVVAENPAPI